MTWNRFKILFVTFLLLAIPIGAIFLNFHASEGKNDNPPETSEPSEPNDDDGNTPAPPPSNQEPELVWGVDTASLTDQELYLCIRENFGEPVVWGRYLGDKDGVSFGLTTDQVNLIHTEGAKILVIYNQFTDATGYENGISQAEEAIRLAKEIGVPEGVAIFANIEPIYPVDADFIRGWYEGISDIYTPAIYGIFDPDRDLYTAYIQAVEENEEIRENTYLWTAAPNIGITSEENAPEYEPVAPDNSLIIGWQYGIDAETCNIDTNLFNADYLELLWSSEQ